MDGPMQFRTRGLIYKMLRRNYPKIDRTFIYWICVRVIHKMNRISFRCEIYESKIILNLHTNEWFQHSACKLLLINVINM